MGNAHAEFLLGVANENYQAMNGYLWVLKQLWGAINLSLYHNRYAMKDWRQDHLYRFIHFTIFFSFFCTYRYKYINYNIVILWQYLKQKLSDVSRLFLKIAYSHSLYTVKSDTLNQVDISMSNCTRSWQLLGVMWKSDFRINDLHYSK